MANHPSPYFIRRTIPAPDEELVEDPYETEVDDDETPVFWEYWRILRKRRWLIAACAVAGVLGAGLFAFTRTPLYTAKSTIMIEREPARVVNMQDAARDPGAPDWTNSYENTQYEILRRPAFAAKTIREAGLESDPVLNAPKNEVKGLIGTVLDNASTWIKRAMADIYPTTPEKEKVKSTFNFELLGTDPGLVGRYVAMLNVQPVRNTRLFEIDFTTPDPGLSARLANAHAESYMRYGVDLRSQANEAAIVFLQEKLLELKERVETSEAALNSYRRQKGIITLDDKGNLVVDRLVDLNERLTEAEANRIALESEVQTIRKGKYHDLPRVRQSAIISALKSKLGELEAEYVNMAGEFKPGYSPLDNLKLKVDEVRKRMSREVQSEVNAIKSAYQVAKNNERQLRQKMEQQKKAALNLKDAAVKYAILAREVDTNKQLYDSVLERMKEMSVAAQVQQSNASIVEKALIPGGPSYPKKTLILMLGLFFGIGGGVGLAFFLDHIDTTIKTPDDVERYLNLPSLGVVPDFVKLKGKSNGYLPAGVNNHSLQNWNGNQRIASELVVSHHPRSVVAESYRTLRTAILLSRAGAPPRTVLFTSASRGEGKTATAINTSVIFAQMGYRVMVVDADMRRPRSHKVLSMENERGLAEVLTGHCGAAEVTLQTSEDNLYFLSSGAEPPNPSELLSSKKMKQLLTELEEEFDCVVIDSPPVMPVSDPVLLSTMVDGVVIVVDSQNTPKQLVRDVRSRLKKAHAKVLGVVLNRVDLRNGDYASYYKHYYSAYEHDS